MTAVCRIEALEERKLLLGGDLDTTFGTGGRVVGSADLPIPLPARSTTGNDLVVLGDGSVLVAGIGETSSGRTISVVKYNPAGELDRTFGERGMAVHKAERFSYPSFARLAVDSLGRIIVLAQGHDADIRPRSVLLRLTPSGSLDRSAGEDGVATLPIGALAIHIDADNRVLVAGAGAVMRLNGDLRPDKRFADGGVARIDAAGTLRAVAVDSFHRVIATGELDEGNQQYVSAVRLTARGKLDRSFDRNGIAALPGTVGTTVLPQADGRFVVGGWQSYSILTDSYQPRAAPTALRVNLDGTLDPGFGGNMLALGVNQAVASRVLPDWLLSEHPVSLAARPDGGFALASIDAEWKLDGSGKPDDSFGLGGYRLLGEPLPDEATYEGGSTRISVEPSRGVLHRLFNFPMQTYTALPYLVSRFERGTADPAYSASLRNEPVTPWTGWVLSDGRLLALAQVESGHLLSNVRPDGTLDAARSRWLGDGPNHYARVLVQPSPLGGYWLSHGSRDQSDSDGYAGGARYIDEGGIQRVAEVNAASYDETSVHAFDVLPGGYVFHSYENGSFGSTPVLLTRTGRSIGRPLPVIVEPDAESFLPAYTSSMVPVGSGGASMTFGDQWYRADDGYLAKRNVLMRVNDAGDPDPRFGAGGFVTIDRADFDLKFAQWNGAAIYTLGPASDGFRRLRPDGSPDARFGRNGVAAAGFDHIEQDSAGRLVAWRVLRGGAADGDVQVIRLTANGKIDTTFGGGDGVVVIDTKLDSSATANLMVRADDRILVTAVKGDGVRVRWSAVQLTA